MKVSSKAAVILRSTKSGEKAQGKLLLFVGRAESFRQMQRVFKFAFDGAPDCQLLCASDLGQKSELEVKVDGWNSASKCFQVRSRMTQKS